MIRLANCWSYSIKRTFSSSWLWISPIFYRLLPPLALHPGNKFTVHSFRWLSVLLPHHQCIPPFKYFECEGDIVQVACYKLERFYWAWDNESVYRYRKGNFSASRFSCFRINYQPSFDPLFFRFLYNPGVAYHPKMEQAFRDLTTKFLSFLSREWASGWISVSPNLWW